MKKKGFTLIELLAVIVILAIIAIIATPQILGVVEKTRIGSAESSALGYIDAVEKYVVMHEVNSKEYQYDLKGKTLNVASNTNISLLDLFIENVKADNIIPPLNDIINVKGEKPTSGTVTIDDNGKVVSSSLVFRNYEVECTENSCSSRNESNSEKNSSNEPNVLMNYTINYNANGGSGMMEATTNDIATNTFTAPTDMEFKEWNTSADGSGVAYNSLSEVTGNLTLYAIWKKLYYEPGDLVYFDPISEDLCDSTHTSSSSCYKWRVITVGDTASNENITIQMDHNLVNKSGWVVKADYNDDENWNSKKYLIKGPITALKALEAATSNWTRLSGLTYSYDTSLGGTNTGNHYGTLSCNLGVCIIAGNQLTTNLKARMITGEEIKQLTLNVGVTSGTRAYNWTLASSYDDFKYYFSNSGKIIGTYDNVATGDTGNTSLSWLVENTTAIATSGATANLYDDSNQGYWTLSPTSSSVSYAWHINNNGIISADSVNYSIVRGIRPVITISKTLVNS